MGYSLHFMRGIVRALMWEAGKASLRHNGVGVAGRC